MTLIKNTMYNAFSAVADSRVGEKFQSVKFTAFKLLLATIQYSSKFLSKLFDKIGSLLMQLSKKCRDKKTEIIEAREAHIRNRE